MGTYYYKSQTPHYEPYLAHYGVKGMKWGVRNEARKDAKEYQKARMATGIGAGNRRKNIKNRVERNRTRLGKRDYDKAFDYYNKRYEARSDLYAKQDVHKHNAKTAYRVGKRAVKATVAATGMIYTAAVVTGRDKDLIRVVNKGIDAVEYRIRGYRYV
nr:MAG TPA: hypothetical protein [Bacteriophage sp.]